MNLNRKPRILLLVDYYEWAFHNTARAIVRHLSDEFDFRIDYVSYKPDLSSWPFDLVHVFFWGETYHQNFVDDPRRVIKLVSSHKWEYDNRWGPLTPQQMVKKYLSDAATITTTSKRLQSMISPCREILWTPNGFDQETFFPVPRSGDIKIGWAGNPKTLGKGFYEILLPAAANDFELHIAGGDLDHGDMRDFYNSLDVLCVSSFAEGEPLPLIEGMACGCFPVCVDVGIVPELVTHPENGLIINRNIEAFRAAFQWCKLNLEHVREVELQNAALMQRERTWDKASIYWREMFRNALSRLNEPTRKLILSTNESLVGRREQAKENVPSVINNNAHDHKKINSNSKAENCIIVTIDTECDKSIDWTTGSPLTFRGVEEAVPELLQPVFSEFGIKPTYLLSPEVMCSRECCSIFREVKNVELGTHLHGDYIVPQIKTWNFAGSMTDDMQWEYAPELERAKLQTLTELFIQQFGFRPTSFRAGRYGVGHFTGRWLQELGYLVDTSVTPHLIWTNKNGLKFPGFENVQELPYRISTDGDIWKSGESDLLEVPITILQNTKLSSSARIRSLSSYQSESIWFRPWSSDAETMCNIIKYAATESMLVGRGRPLVMMFHNVELIPGASPRPQTESDVIRYLDTLRRTFELTEKMGIKSYTLTEYYYKYLQEEEASKGRNTFMSKIYGLRGTKRMSNKDY